MQHALGRACCSPHGCNHGFTSFRTLFVLQIKEAVYGIKVERKASTLAAGAEACEEGVTEGAAALASAAGGLGSAEAVAAAGLASAKLRDLAEQV